VAQPLSAAGRRSTRSTRTPSARSALASPMMA